MHHHLGAIWVWSSVSVSIVVALVCVLRFSQSLSDLAFTKIAYMLCLSLSTPSWSLCLHILRVSSHVVFGVCVCAQERVHLPGRGHLASPSLTLYILARLALHISLHLFPVAMPFPFILLSLRRPSLSYALSLCLAIVP